MANQETWRGLDGRLLRSDAAIREIWAWGGNGQGQLGDNSTVSKSSPVSIVGGYTNWCQVDAGTAHTAAIGLDGSLWAWGCNGQGRLGDRTVTNRSSPVKVVGGIIDWCIVNVGDNHTAAIRSNSELWMWGNNQQGRLGDGTTVSKSSPVSIVGGFTDWCQVSLGENHSLGLRSNYTLWSWGSGSGGILGDGTTIGRSSPVSVVGGFTDWCQVAAGCGHSTAVRLNGSLWAWGCNSQGRLGDGTGISRSSPVSVVGGFTDWCQVSAGDLHTLAVRNNGTLWAWGGNTQGRLGDGTTVSTRSSPVSVVGGYTDWCSASVGLAHNIAIRTNGTIWTWGCNNLGQLGIDNIVDISSPVSIVGGFTGWRLVGAGGNHSLAVKINS
jgi:alpha-tubulin suppressor-like RCC1 family protein